MKKKLIAIAIAGAIAMPLTAQATSLAESYFATPTHQVSVSKASNSKVNVGLVATKATNSVVIAINTERPYKTTEEVTLAVTPGRDGWEDHKTIAANTSGVSGGDSIGISKTS